MGLDDGDRTARVLEVCDVCPGRSGERGGQAEQNTSRQISRFSLGQVECGRHEADAES